jgi:putative CocE/NonD family hydrolase
MKMSLKCLSLLLIVGWSAEAAVADPEPSYAVKKELNVLVPMRDGVHLSTDVYRPDAPGRFPVILERTPYDNNLSFGTGMRYARRGYVFITQDVRGRHDSEGEWTPFMNEAKDGYDTQEWAGRQPWSTGKICTTGGSYLGFTQWASAPLHNEHLTCMVPEVAPPGPFKNIPYENGVPMMFGAQWMLLVQGRTMQLRGHSFGEIFGDAFYDELYDWARVKRTLPLIDLDKAAGYDSSWWHDWMRHDSNDEFYRRVDYQANYDQVDVPVFHISGWYDHDFPGTFMNYPGMVLHGKSDFARKHQKLLIMPFGHWGRLQPSM